ncbi:MAG: hypothetical protein IPK58_04390 [Acidobacteria bacterium]|nr:hypothetical protein [Acidobacteriota bacterium]
MLLRNSLLFSTAKRNASIQLRQLELQQYLTSEPHRQNARPHFIIVSYILLYNIVATLFLMREFISEVTVMNGILKLTGFLFLLTVLTASSAVLSDAARAWVAQEQVVLRGSQIRGVPGRDAKLESNPVTLRRAGEIDSVEGGRAGFWIEGTRRMTFDSAAEAVGVRLPAGTYRVYPNLPRDAERPP